MPLAWILIKTWFGLSSRLGTSFTSHFALTAGTIAAFIVTPRFSLRSVSSRFLLWAELVHVSYIGNSRSSQTPTVRERTFSITPGKGQCAAARSRMREGRGGILFVADTRSRRNSQKEPPSLRQVFLRLAKVSRQRRPRALGVPPLTFRFLT